jgi:hypothetical protein
LTHKLQITRIQQKRTKGVIKKKVKGLKKFGGDKNVDVHRAHFSICGGGVKG